MKKTYQRPYVKVVEMDAQSIICASVKKSHFSEVNTEIKVTAGETTVWDNE